MQSSSHKILKHAGRCINQKCRPINLAQNPQLLSKTPPSQLSRHRILGGTAFRSTKMDPTRRQPTIYNKPNIRSRILESRTITVMAQIRSIPMELALLFAVRHKNFNSLRWYICTHLVRKHRKTTWRRVLHQQSFVQVCPTVWLFNTLRTSRRNTCS